MSARDELFLWIDDSLSTETASQLIDAYAHELAEQIRNDDFPGYREERFYTGVEAAADLIDPWLKEN